LKKNEKKANDFLFLLSSFYYTKDTPAQYKQNTFSTQMLRTNKHVFLEK